MDIAALEAGQWDCLRRARLRALKDCPSAFLSSYVIESAWGEDQWRDTFGDATWVVARDGSRIVGMAHSLLVADRPADERHIECVWVDPRHRRVGVLKAMLGFLFGAEPDVRTWMVWAIEGHIVDDATSSRDVYERLGFYWTGERQLLPDDSGRIEIRLKREQPRGT